MKEFCAGHCIYYDYFAITPDYVRCLCVEDYPGFDKRIAIGQCQDSYEYSTSSTDPGQMNLFLAEESSDNNDCQNAEFRDLAQRLASTGSFYMGYDILTNEAKPGNIFASNILDCGTSVYKIRSMVRLFLFTFITVESGLRTYFTFF